MLNVPSVQQLAMSAHHIAPSASLLLAPVVRADGVDAHLQATIVAGGLSKLARDGILHPLDTLKTRAQVPCRQQREVAQTVSLYAGVLPTLLLSVPAGGAYFGLKSWATELGSSAVLAAALAATGYWFVRTPAELLKTRAMTDDSQPFLQGDVRRLTSLLRDEGVAALWTGYGATTFRSIPFEILRLSLYPLLLGSLAATVTADAFSGALAGFASSASAAVLTQPLDTIKTSLQLAEGAGRIDETGAATSPVDRFVRAVRHIVSDGRGPVALYRGSLYLALNAGLAGGITFGTYQLALPWVERVLNAV